MQVRVDEAWDDDFSRHVDFAGAAIVAKRSHDPVVADGDIALDQLAADQIENPPAFQHDIGGAQAPRLFDGAREIGDGIGHERFPLRRKT